MLTSVLMLLAALLLVAANAFFVLAEFAIVKIRRTRLEELALGGNKTAKAAAGVVGRLDSYLSAVQLGITLASLGLGWLGEPAVARLISPILLKFSIFNDGVLLHTVSFIVSFTIITLLHVVLGELVPKSIAIQKSERAVILITWPLILFHKIAYPFVFIFDRIAALCLRLIGIAPAAEHENAHSEEEIRMIVSASQSGGILNVDEGQMLDNVFEFADKNAREIMVPRTDMVCVYLEDSFEESLETILNSNHTRFPLCRDNTDNIIGMVHLRDILHAMHKSKVRDLKKLKREVLFVPETKNIAAVMKLMRTKRIHLAVVIDEYGGTAGLVSLEDIIEELVGDISDEYDMDFDDVVELSPGNYEVKGLMSVGDIEKLIGRDIGDQEDDTIGGVIFSLLGRKPAEGDRVIISGHHFEVTQVKNLRIEKVKIYPER